jgi:ABC-type siderophore export system fused ATPase/permease subunit
MAELIKLILPIFYTTKNYEDVLKRLAGFAFYETYFITLLLRSNSRVKDFFTSVESWGSVGDALRVIAHYDVINITGIVIALVVAVVTHMFHFHDRISDVLGIRRRFDINNILMPLSQRVHAVITEDKELKIARQRHELMHAVFYKYASSRAANPLVDKHDIEHALNAWSWFWVCLEGVVYFGAGACVGWWLGSSELGLVLVIVSAVLVILAAAQRLRLGRYARTQVESIASDPTAAYEIKNRFDAL